jgi:hypothetical protein
VKVPSGRRTTANEVAVGVDREERDAAVRPQDGAHRTEVRRDAETGDVLGRRERCAGPPHRHPHADLRSDEDEGGIAAIVHGQPRPDRVGRVDAGRGAERGGAGEPRRNEDAGPAPGCTGVGDQRVARAA